MLGPRSRGAISCGMTGESRLVGPSPVKINALLDVISTYCEAAVSPAAHAFGDQLIRPENQQAEQGKFRPSSSGFVHYPLPGMMARSTESQGTCAARQPLLTLDSVNALVLSCFISGMAVNLHTLAKVFLYRIHFYEELPWQVT